MKESVSIYFTNWILVTTSWITTTLSAFSQRWSHGFLTNTIPSSSLSLSFSLFPFQLDVCDHFSSPDVHVLCSRIQTHIENNWWIMMIILDCFSCLSSCCLMSVIHDSSLTFFHLRHPYFSALPSSFPRMEVLRFTQQG